MVEVEHVEVVYIRPNVVVKYLPSDETARRIVAEVVAEVKAIPENQEARKPPIVVRIRRG